MEKKFDSNMLTLSFLVDERENNLSAPRILGTKVFFVGFMLFDCPQHHLSCACHEKEPGYSLLSTFNPFPQKM